MFYSADQKCTAAFGIVLGGIAEISGQWDRRNRRRNYLKKQFDWPICHARKMPAKRVAA